VGALPYFLFVAQPFEGDDGAEVRGVAGGAAFEGGDANFIPIGA